ncbi:MAG: tetratricopeptide repeat protein [Verrucomicrobia bacterium]|nr:tetratricopeptide repeat protein [Verrucomicrobiota bacterium]
MESKPNGQQLIERLLLDPENWELRLSAAATLAAEGRTGESITILDSAPNPPDSEPELLQCAEIFAQTQPAKAIQLLHDWLRDQPTSAIVHLAMADTAFRLGDMASAQAYYRRGIELQPVYRDPDLEVRYGLPPVRTQPSLPVATAEPVPPPGTQTSPGPAENPGSPSPALGLWITAATALGVFLLGWLFTILALRSMIGG